MRRSIFVSGLVALGLAFPGRTWADAVPTARVNQDTRSAREVRNQTAQEARKQHRAGVEAFAAGRYDQAISAFLSADALHPSSASSFNIAKAYEAQGDSPRALAYYREYLRRSPGATDRAMVNAKVAKLTKDVAGRGVQQVTFLATPQGASVSVDSEPIGSAPITLELRPGSHVVEFRKTGYVPARFTFELTTDRALDVLAKLAKAGKAGAVASANGANSEVASAANAAEASRARLEGEGSGPRRTSVTRTIGFAALGASVAAFGGAVTLEVMRARAEDEARNETDQVGFSEAYERMKSRQTMARVFAGAGGALAALGGVLLVVASGESVERPTATSKSKPRGGGGLALGCTPVKCQALYRGAF